MQVSTLGGEEPRVRGELAILEIATKADTGGRPTSEPKRQVEAGLTEILEHLNNS